MSLDFSKFTINKDIPIPLYYQINQFIYLNIMDGNLAVDECLPTEFQLMEAFGVSRSTIRQAMAELITSGFLVRKKGKGTFIAMPKQASATRNDLTNIGAFDYKVDAKGGAQRTEIIELCEVGPIEYINEILQIPSTGRLVRLLRRRFAGNEPVVIIENYLSIDSYGKLLSMDLTNKSLYTVLENEFNTPITKVIRNIESMIVEDEDAKLLNINKKSAILYNTTIGYSNDTPIEYSFDKYRGDMNKFLVEITRWIK